METGPWRLEIVVAKFYLQSAYLKLQPHLPGAIVWLGMHVLVIWVSKLHLKLQQMHFWQLVLVNVFWKMLAILFSVLTWIDFSSSMDI